MGEVDEMKRSAAWVAMVAVAIELATGLSVAAAEKVLPAGGGQNVACLDYGVEMRNGKEVKSCLLAAPGDFPAAGGQTIACAAKYSIAFRTDGKVEYCTLSKDMEFRRTAQESRSAETIDASSLRQEQTGSLPGGCAGDLPDRRPSGDLHAGGSEPVPGRIEEKANRQRLPGRRPDRL